MRTYRAVAGFTLVELLVALAVFAVVSSAAYVGLTRVLDARAHLQESDRRFAAIQRLMLLLEREVVQMADRPVRNEFGDLDPALRLDENQGMEWSRFGRPNPAGLTQSGLWRVGYGKDDERLVRRVWPVLDRAPDTPMFEETVLEDMDDFAVEALWEGRWFGEWPPQPRDGETPSGPDVIPDALRIRVEVEGAPPLEQTILIASGGRVLDAAK